MQYSSPAYLVCRSHSLIAGASEPVLVSAFVTPLPAVARISVPPAAPLPALFPLPPAAPVCAGSFVFEDGLTSLPLLQAEAQSQAAAQSPTQTRRLIIMVVSKAVPPTHAVL
jgi:hypothetical protein